MMRILFLFYYKYYICKLLKKISNKKINNYDESRNRCQHFKQVGT